MLHIALIVGTTRAQRFADHVAQWLLDGARERQDMRLELVDLRDYPLPLLGEEQAGGAQAVAGWKRLVASYDGYVMTAAEYNHGPSAVLKNALDSAYKEWNRKPVAFVGYGGAGGARAVEQLRLIAIELQLAPIRNAVHIGMEPMLAVSQGTSRLGDYAYLNESRTAMLDQLAWWGEALRQAREVDAAR